MSQKKRDRKKIQDGKKKSKTKAASTANLARKVARIALLQLQLLKKKIQDTIPGLLRDVHLGTVRE